MNYDLNIKIGIFCSTDTLSRRSNAHIRVTAEGKELHKLLIFSRSRVSLIYETFYAGILFAPSSAQDIFLTWLNCFFLEWGMGHTPAMRQMECVLHLHEFLVSKFECDEFVVCTFPCRVNMENNLHCSEAMAVALAMTEVLFALMAF